VLSIPGLLYATECIPFSAEALLDARREFGLEVNTEKIKYMVVSPSEYRTK